MQHVTKELTKLVRKEAEIDLKAQTGCENLKPEQIERRYRELMVEEYQLNGLPVPEKFSRSYGTVKGKTA